MKERSYRMAQYEIILESNGGIWWKSHRGFAETKCGRCFIEGSVLFLGPSEAQERGYLKNEFLEYLQQLPQWDRTEYYCPSYTLYNCKGGRVGGYSKQHRTVEPDRSHTTAEAIDHSPLDPSTPPFGERKQQDGFESLASVLNAEEKIGESERRPAAPPTVKITARTALTSLYPTVGIKHVKGKLGKALRRCKTLAGLNSEKDDSG